MRLPVTYTADDKERTPTGGDKQNRERPNTRLAAPPRLATQRNNLNANEKAPGR